MAGLELIRFSLHGRCELLGCDNLVGKGTVRQATHGRVGLIFIALVSPVLHVFAGIRQRQEQQDVQKLCP